MLQAIFNKIYTLYLRKKQKLNLLELNKPCYVHPSATFNFHRKISIGQYCRIGKECHIDGEGVVRIGDGTILAPRVTILSSSHNYKSAEELPYGSADEKFPVTIGKGCWLGWGAIIRPGVTIEDGAIVAMGSVVTKNIGLGEIVGGNPARVINKRENINEISLLVKNENYYMKKLLEGKIVREGRSKNINENVIK